jgi:tetratricopeptide (TPR) repeat protein
MIATSVMSEIESPQQPAPLTTEQILRQAVGYHQAGQLPDAERLYRIIIQTQPNHPDANHNLGLIAVQAKQLASSLPHFKAALEANPAQWQYWLSYTNALVEAGKARTALNIVEIAMQRGLDTPAVHALRQKIERAVLNTDANNTAPESAEIDQIVALFNTGQYVEMERRVREQLKTHPNSGFAWKVLGTALNAQGKDAIFELQKATQFLPWDAETHYNLGVALSHIGKLDDAMASYRTALAIKPEDAKTHYNAGVTLANLGQLDDAMASYKRALEIQPDFAEAHNNMGAALAELGRFDAAVESYALALQIKPDFAGAHNNLANALKNLGKRDEAVASYRRALQIKPDFAEAHNNLGSALKDLGQFESAAASYQRAVEINPDFAEAHNNLGNVLKSLGQFDDALTSYRRALEIKPDFAEAHNNLGITLTTSEHFDEITASFRRAIKIRPNFAEAYVNLGLALKNLNRNEAEAHCCKALEINPDLVSAMIFLAELKTDKGQFSQAEEILRRAISIEPDSPEAWARLAGLRKMTSEDTDWLTAAQRIVAQNLAPAKEAILRFAIGKYYDDVKNHEQAFLNYRRANELLKSGEKKYDREQQTRVVDLICRTYDRDWVGRERLKSNTSTRPVFIVGMPRTGTSLAEQILASHPSVFGAGELTFWNAASKIHEASALKGEMNEGWLCDAASDYLQFLNNFSPDALRVVDKMPHNFLYLGLIRAAFPNARIIHMQRNPIDTCLSIYFQYFNSSHFYANDLEDLAHYYKEYRRTMTHWRAILPPNTILDVPYEELVSDQAGWSRKMLDFIDLPWDDRCLDFHQSVRTVGTVSNWQVRQKINKTSVVRWRNYEKFVGPLLDLID